MDAGRLLNNTIQRHNPNTHPIGNNNPLNPAPLAAHHIAHRQLPLFAQYALLNHYIPWNPQEARAQADELIRIPRPIVLRREEPIRPNALPNLAANNQPRLDLFAYPLPRTSNPQDPF